VNISAVKRLFSGLVLLGLLVAPVRHAWAQQAGVAGGQVSTPEAQSPEKNKQEQDENDVYLHSPSVKALGAKLGMNPQQAATTFQVLNFSFLLVLVGAFLLRALPKTFRSRNDAIQKHLVDARTATEEASARLNRVEDRLSKLDVQIAAMREQADKDSALDERRIKASVEEEKKRILEAAEQEIAAATTHAQRQLQQYAAELAIEQAARKLVVSAETDRLLIQGFARRLTGDGSKEGQN
jgi:F-type H+-transporting ATPase subunit b